MLKLPSLGKSSEYIAFWPYIISFWLMLPAAWRAYCYPCVRSLIARATGIAQEYCSPIVLLLPNTEYQHIQSWFLMMCVTSASWFTFGLQIIPSSLEDVTPLVYFLIHCLVLSAAHFPRKSWIVVFRYNS